MEDDATGASPTEARPNTRLRLIIAIAVLLAVAIALAVLNQVIKTNEKSLVTWPAQYDRVRVDGVNASVKVVHSTTSDIEIRTDITYVLRKPTIKQIVESGVLEVSSECPNVSIGECSIDFEIALPPNARAFIETGNGSVRLDGVKAEVDVKTNTGKVIAADTFGIVRAETKDGSIEGSDLSSLEVTAKSQKAPVKLQFAASPTGVEARSGDGAVSITVPKTSSPFKVQADSGNGRVTVDVRTDPQSPRTLIAHSDEANVEVVGR